MCHNLFKYLVWQTLLDAHPTATPPFPWLPEPQFWSGVLPPIWQRVCLRPDFSQLEAPFLIKERSWSVILKEKSCGGGKGSEKGVLDNNKRLEEEMPFLFAGHHSSWAQNGGVIDIDNGEAEKWKAPVSLRRSLSCSITQPWPHVTARPPVWCIDKSPIVQAIFVRPNVTYSSNHPNWWFYPWPFLMSMGFINSIAITISKWEGSTVDMSE